VRLDRADDVQVDRALHRERGEGEHDLRRGLPAGRVDLERVRGGLLDELSGLDAIRYISWAGWVTLGFQVMPVFFLVGGYVHATSWTRRHGRGGDWAEWVREHAMGLLWPTTVYVAAAIIAVAGARMTGAGTAELAQAGWLVALQLWFLPVYLLLIALTPAMLAAHRR
jgi:hypothetical protein